MPSPAVNAALRARPLGLPTWAHDFRNGQIPAGATFSRASAGWYYNALGLLTQASSNAPRFDYDPATLTPLGYLAEMASTNLCTRSRALSGASYTATGVTVTDNAVTGPDGTTSASTLLESAGTSAHRVVGGDLSGLASSTFGLAFSVKNVAGSRWVQFSIGSDRVNFNPSTGAIGSITSGMTSASARQLANGFWRFSVLWTNPGFGGPGYGLALVQSTSSAAGESYAGDGTSTLAITDVQIETAGVGITSPIVTTGSTVTRAQDLLYLPLTSVIGWDASKGGIIVAAYRLHTLTPAVQQKLFEIDDGDTTTNVVNVNGYNGGSSKRGFDIYAASSHLISLDTGGAQSIFTRTKVASGWGVPRAFQAADGAGLASGSSNGVSALPSGMTHLRIGTGLGGQQLNGTIESIAYYRGARADGFVQAVSR